MVSRYHPPPAFRSLESEAVSYAHGGLCDLSHCTPPIRPALWRKFTSSGPEGPTTMLKIIVLGCVLAAVAVTLKIRLDTPRGPQPLARAIVTTHLQSLQRDLALP
jgi:hypothetical protein